MTEQQTTGIANADRIIETARAAGLTVDIKRSEGPGYIGYTVHIGYAVQAYAKGTALELCIEGDWLTMGWYRSSRKGARGKLLSATWRQLTGCRELRTLKRAAAHVEYMVREQARQVAEQRERDAAAVVAEEREDVTTMFSPGESVRVVPQSWDGFAHVYVPQPEFIGTVVSYHRNGQYIVREPEHGTTCHYSATGKVELFKLESGGERPESVSAPEFEGEGWERLPEPVVGEIRDLAYRVPVRAVARHTEPSQWSSTGADAVTYGVVVAEDVPNIGREGLAYRAGETLVRESFVAVSAPVSAEERPGGESVPVAAMEPCESTQGVPSGLLDDEARAAAEAELLTPRGERLALRVVQSMDERESVEERDYVVGLVAAQLRAGARLSRSDVSLVLRWEGVTTVVGVA